MDDAPGRKTLTVSAGFSWPTRVYWEDTDAGGVVYHGQYVSFLERARTEWMRSLGFGQAALRESHDLVFAIRDMQVDFLRPARLDDALQVDVELRACRGASLVFAQSVRRDGERLLVAQVRAAALSAGSFRPRSIPRAMLDVLEPLQLASS